MLPASTFALTESLSALCSKGEKALGLEVVCMCVCMRMCVCVRACVEYMCVCVRVYLCYMCVCVYVCLCGQSYIITRLLG